ncbi:MAG: phosphatase PAP2 family protein [Bacteroidota bacterium]|nr:phosphatase PAP2 family protein [Bacteroidota bacterium]
MKNILFALLTIMAFEANARVEDNAQNSKADTIKKDRLIVPDTVNQFHSKPGSVVVPVVLVGYGLASFVVHPIRRFDYYVRDRIQVSDPNYKSKMADYLQLAPIALVYGLNLVGDHGQNRFVDRTALLALSAGILTIADGSKYLAHRVRPYGTDPLSFPSGHTGAAFMAAEYLAREFGDKSPWYSILGYTMASTTGVLRLYGKAHWFSDCVAGAGIGMLSTKAAYWLYPHIRKALSHKDKNGRTTMLMPTYQEGTPGLSFAMQL